MEQFDTQIQARTIRILDRTWKQHFTALKYLDFGTKCLHFIQKKYINTNNILLDRRGDCNRTK